MLISLEGTEKSEEITWTSFSLVLKSLNFYLQCDLFSLQPGASTASPTNHLQGSQTAHTQSVCNWSLHILLCQRQRTLFKFYMQSTATSCHSTNGPSLALVSPVSVPWRSLAFETAPHPIQTCRSLVSLECSVSLKWSASILSHLDSTAGPILNNKDISIRKCQRFRHGNWGVSAASWEVE